MAEVPQQITDYLTRNKVTTTRIVPLTGDASDRRYYRIFAAERAPFVLGLNAQPFDYDTLPFVNVATLLAAMPVPIPTIIGHEDDLGILAMQDLGDVTLQAHLGAASPKEHAALYRQAVSFIHTLQRRGAELRDPKFIPYGVAFDVDKLTWEMDFFVKHFLEAYRGVVFAPADREEVRAELGKIVAELAAEPRVLCHRDYHSRNLMLNGDKLFIIDFQDARLGPDTYDLASLLRDSYMDLTEDYVDELLAYFLALQGRSNEAEQFRTRFDLMAVQRNFKALGTFGYQTTARQNPVYIQYMPRTLRYARENVFKYSRFARLRELLGAHLDEFK
jgi:aminoglycoside/choline kinase family phosphotransferase